MHSSDFSMSATNTVYGWVETDACSSSSQAPKSHHCLKMQSIYQQTQDFLVLFLNVEDATDTQTEEKVELWYTSSPLTHAKTMDIMW